MRNYAPYFVIIFLLSFGLLPWISPYVHGLIYLENPHQILSHPSLQHLLGTDAKGRDFFFRLFYGASLSLWMSLIINMIGVIIGVIMGIFLFIFLRKVGLQVIESLLAIPFFVLGGIFSVIFGTSILSLIISFGLLMALPYAYMAQSYMLTIINAPFIKKSKSIGHSSVYIFFTHMIPIIRDRIAYQSWISIHSTIFALASMTFLGFGIQAPTPEWGSLIYAALPYIKTNLILLIAPFLLFVLLSWAIYTLTNSEKKKRNTFYPLFPLKDKGYYYLIAQIDSFKAFITNGLKQSTDNTSSVALKEDYHFNFPKSHTIEQFLKDLLGQKYTQQYQQIQSMLHTLELPLTVLKQTPQKLSGGMLQRMSIIMGCLINPKTFILEYPFSSLNSKLKHKTAQFLTQNNFETLFITAPYLDLPSDIQPQFNSITKLYNNQYIDYKNILQPVLPEHKRPLSQNVFISVHNIQTDYYLPCFKDFDLQIYEQEILGIVGYSGIGKTTLGKILAGLLPLNAGILESSVPIKPDMIQQDPVQFNGDLIVEKTLSEFSFKRHTKLGLTNLLLKLDLPKSLLKEPMKNLSKNEQYQVLFLRSILYQPNLLILDEMLDHIPYEKYGRFLEILNLMRTDTKTSIVLISHQQELLYKIADRVILLSDKEGANLEK